MPSDLAMGAKKAAMAGGIEVPDILPKKAGWKIPSGWLNAFYCFAMDTQPYPTLSKL